MAKLFFKDKKILPLILIIIICIVITPFFVNPVNSDLWVSLPQNNKIGKAGETVEFNLTYTHDGGEYDKVIEITNIDKIGDWSIGSGGRTVTLPPDSRRTVIISVNIPENASNNDYYYFNFDLRGDFHRNDREFTVTVDNRDPPKIYVSHDSSNSGVGATDFALTPFVFIPEVIIVICVILLFVFAKKSKSDEMESEPSQH